MAIANVPIFPSTLLNSLTVFNSGTSTVTPTQILASQTNGCKVENIVVSSTFGSSAIFKVYFNISATNYLIASITIPANAGTDGSTPSVNILQALSAGGNYMFPLSLDSNNNPYIYLASGTSLTAAPSATLTSSLWNILVTGGAF